MNDPTDNLVSLDQVSARINGVMRLSDIQLDIKQGQIISLIGPNGAGKTTLIKIILGLIKPHTGSVTRRPGLRIGYMPQKLHIEATLPITVKRFLQLAPGANRAALSDTLAKVDCAQLENRPMHELSGGEFQRVLLARCILQEPHLLVLDEPAQGVDVNGQNELYQLIGEIRDQLGCGVIMVSHDLHLVMSATDFVVCINHHICCSGHPEQVTKDPAYKALFGEDIEGFALYEHHHDHCHDNHGNVIKKPGK